MAKAKFKEVEGVQVLPAIAPALQKQALSIIGEIVEVVSCIKEYHVDDKDQYEQGAQDLRTLKAKVKELDGAKKRILAPLNEARAATSEMFRGPEKMLDDAIRLINGAMVHWKQEEERKRLAAIEQNRALAQQRNEDMRRNLLERAKAEMVAGDSSRACELVEEAAAFQDKAFERSLPQPALVEVKGVRKNWYAQIVDPLKVPREFLCPDIKKLNEYARNLKEEAKVEGVVFAYTETVVSTREV